MPNRPSKDYMPPARKKGGGGGSSSQVGFAGDFSPEYDTMTTAEPLENDGEETGGSENEKFGAVETKTQGDTLKGFKDNRGGFRKVFDAMRGYQSPVDSLNANLALGRDTTAQQLNSALKLQQSGGDIDLRNQTAKIGQEGDIRKQLQQSDHKHALKLAGVNNSAISDLSKQNALQSLEAEKQRADTAFAAANNISYRDLDALRQPALSAATAKLGVGQATDALQAKRVSQVSTAMDDPNSDVSKNSLAAMQAPWMQALGNARQASALTAIPGTTAKVVGMPGVSDSFTMQGYIAPDKDLAGNTKPGTGQMPNIENDATVQRLREEIAASKAKQNVGRSSEMVGPVSTTAVPADPTQATGIIPAVGRALPTLFDKASSAAYSGLDSLYTPAKASPEYQQMMQERQQGDPTLVNLLTKFYNWQSNRAANTTAKQMDDSQTLVPKKRIGVRQ